ncbi:hypothetical protein W97_04586 [Coniosporium apollinis CBS 100218]|uniref:Myb-like domain-containing protein n=1 Tax=Coniosporium apollinis (strain CBS 100218) TaxID=1168221 RepID=R7YU18_CONA1|nr:uncharacterized protein W97_04586 [Coniosporium apollinis CBS 100218]EON65348.1 hypothetical protein W97_04586 [Coniosporium apollinis CBS 100218]
MLENLSPLYSAAENILEIVAPVKASKGDLRSIIKQIRASTSRTAKRFAIKQKAIEPYIEAFDSRNMIRRDVVLKAFFHPTTVQDLDSHPWRPDLILYKANLAIMAKQLLSLDRDDTGSWDSVRELDNSFPLQFLSTFPASDTDTAIGFVGGSRLLKETFTFALELRTQLAIILLSEKYEALSRSPHNAVAQLFGAAAAGEDSAPVDIVEGSQIRGWGIEALCESKDHIPRNFTRQVTQRVNEIKSYFTGDEEYTVDYEGLSERFPWREFVAQALEWIRMRNMEIEEQLEHAGGVERLSFLLDQELQSGQKPRTSLGGASTATAVSTSGQSPRRSRNSGVSPDGQFEEAGDLEVAEASSRPPDYTTSGISALKKRAARLTGQFSQPPSASKEPRFEEDLVPADPVDDDWQAAPVDDYDDINADAPPPPQQPPKSSYSAQVRELQGEENRRDDAPGSAQKPRAFTDRQPNARRVSFDDGFDATQRTQSSAQAGTPPRSSMKRARVDESADSDYRETGADASDDEDFETDKRNISSPQRRRQAQPRQRRPVSEESRVSPNKRQLTGGRYLSQSQVTILNSDADEEAQHEAPQASQLHRMRKQMVKRKMMHRTKQQRERAFWTVEEEEELLDYLKEYRGQAPSWADIKALDQERAKEEDRPEVFALRTQVDLKDKARNMLILYIKSGSGAIPQCLASVRLGRSKKDELERAGFDVSEIP